MAFKKIALAAVIAASSLVSISANAAFITGSAGLAGGVASAGLTNLPTSVVSLLTSFDMTGGAFGTNGTGDLAPVLNANGTISDFFRSPAANTSFVVVIGGFTFTSVSFSNLAQVTFGCTVTNRAAMFAMTPNRLISRALWTTALAASTPPVSPCSSA